MLNFGGSKTQDVPPTRDLRNRKIHTSVKCTAELRNKTFFYNSYKHNKKQFNELHRLCLDLVRHRLDEDSEDFLNNLEELMRACYNYKVEEEVLVNISEVKCKVIKVQYL